MWSLCLVTWLSLLKTLHCVNKSVSRSRSVFVGINGYLLTMAKSFFVNNKFLLATWTIKHHTQSSHPVTNKRTHTHTYTTFLMPEVQNTCLKCPERQFSITICCWLSPWKRNKLAHPTLPHSHEIAESILISYSSPVLQGESCDCLGCEQYHMWGFSVANHRRLQSKTRVSQGIRSPWSDDKNLG